MRAFLNGKIYVSFKPKRVVSAILVENGRVVYAGSGDVVEKLAVVFDAETVDLKGRVVVPGFVDSHIHLDGLGIYLSSLDLRGVESIEELKDKLRSSRESWVIGFGWDQELLGRYPSRRDVDEVVSDRPAILLRFCMHAGVLNTKALELCGIDSDSGLVFEDDLEKALDTFRADLKVEDYERFLEAAIDHLLSLGVTAAGFVSCSRKAFEALLRLHAKGKLKVRVAVYFSEPEVFDLYRGFRSDFLKVNGVKVFVDGSLGARTAWLSEPYEDSATSGFPRIERIELHPNAHMAVHAIGDRAIDLVIRDLPPNHRLEHASVLRDDQLDGVAKLMVSVQPRFIHGDWWIARRLGRRTRWAYRIKSLINRGVIVGFGTDAPVEPANPWETVYSAVTRGKYEGLEIYEYTKDECLSVEEALHCYTCGSARLLLWDEIGSLEPGKFADFVVLDRDPLEVEEEKIREISVLETYVGGSHIKVS